MTHNTAIIATNAECIAGMLGEKMRDADFRVYTAATDNELSNKIKTVYPRFLFIEDCFHHHGTDAFIQRTAKRNRNTGIVVWAAGEVRAPVAARFILAGAESFFSLRDTDSNIERILLRIAGGRHYCPKDVEAVLERDDGLPDIGAALTRRELEVVRMTVGGRTNKEIGEVLGVSYHTVKMHKQNIYRKCGGNTPVDILRQGLMRGIIRPEDFC